MGRDIEGYGDAIGCFGDVWLLVSGDGFSSEKLRGNAGQGSFTCDLVRKDRFEDFALLDLLIATHVSIVEFVGGGFKVGGALPAHPLSTTPP